MALTEIQLPSKSDLYNVAQNVAGEISQSMHRWGLIAEFLNSIQSVDLDAMSITDAQVRDDLVNLRLMLNDITALWNNQAVTPANDPQAVVAVLCKMSHG